MVRFHRPVLNRAAKAMPLRTREAQQLTTTAEQTTASQWGL
jgi:hypothetical protein